MSKLCVVAAGGTGGHMFPAEALARELATRGWRVVLATDHRGQQYAHAFPAEERLALDAATGSGPLGLVKAGVAIFKGVMQARDAFERLGADVVVGFGGYPSAPALVAAVTAQRPTVIHEQNAVLGRTNRILAPYVNQVASAFPTLERAPDKAQGRLHVVGSPVRADIRALFDRAYVAPVEGGPIHVLITGGSQGARLLSETAPDAAAGEIYAVYEGASEGCQHIAYRCPAATTEALRGQFIPLEPARLQAVADPAMRSMLERLCEESRLGNYGVYFGSHEQGQVTRKLQGTAS